MSCCLSLVSFSFNCAPLASCTSNAAIQHKDIHNDTPVQCAVCAQVRYSATFFARGVVHANRVDSADATVARVSAQIAFHHLRNLQHNTRRLLRTISTLAITILFLTLLVLCLCRYFSYLALLILILIAVEKRLYGRMVS